LSKLVESTLDDEGASDEDQIPLPHVKAVVLRKIIAFCEHYQRCEQMTTIKTPLISSKLEDLVQPFYVQLVQVDHKMLFEIVTAANYMDIKPLLDLSCLAVSISIKGKSAEELRALFNLPDGLTPEEEDAAVREENRWAEQAPQAP
jgi:S-phase kinase-associated protein 1